MREILISIQPKWCELIASGKKTVEVRKTRPKIDTPFKCYIYCTKAKEYFSIGGGVYAANDELYRLPTGEIKFGDSFELIADWSGHYTGDNLLNGKVIGEFVCDRVTRFKVFDNDTVQFWNFAELEKSCLTYEQVAEYIGRNNFGFAYHISNLVIYDKPKELSEFHKVGYTETKESVSWLTREEENSWQIKRPPQSWCYVELLKGGAE